MEKPIIATTLSGLFIKKEPWARAHVLWLKEASEKLNDPAIMDWADKPNYFDCVDPIMSKLYPQLSKEERVVKAREIFFDSVCKYIQQNPNVVNQEIVKYFQTLKDKYTLVLITTNTKEAIDKILNLAKLNGLFDIIETSLPTEKDDKRLVFDRFLKKYETPIIYIGSSRKDSFNYCAERGIKAIFANLEAEQEISDIQTIHNLEELKEIISQI